MQKFPLPISFTLNSHSLAAHFQLHGCGVKCHWSQMNQYIPIDFLFLSRHPLLLPVHSYFPTNPHVLYIIRKRVFYSLCNFTKLSWSLANEFNLIIESKKKQLLTNYGQLSYKHTCLFDYVYVTVCLSDCLSIWLSVFLTACLFDCLSIWLPVYLTVCLSDVCLSDICLSDCLSIWLSVYLSVCLIWLSVYLTVCLTVYLSVDLPIYPVFAHFFSFSIQGLFLIIKRTLYFIPANVKTIPILLG